MFVDAVWNVDRSIAISRPESQGDDDIDIKVSCILKHDLKWTVVFEWQEWWQLAEACATEICK